MALALFLALLVNQKIFGSSFFKTIYFYPNVIPMAAASMIWLYIFLPGYGFLNYILGKIGIPSIEWVSDSRFAMWALIIVAIWKNAGYYMVIFLGGLQQLPTEIYEVATIDGASAWRKFWKITWPLLSPTTFFAFIIAVINSFQAVDQIYLMTRGGPANTTNMFVYYIYQVAFKYWDFGYASALTVILLVLLLIFTVLAFFFMERRVFYESGERL
ncbi:carbohydrate ABC transporter permease, partial [Mesotoga sp.]